jgi:hypothetical protein
MNPLIARGGMPLDLDRQRVVFFDKFATAALVKKYGDEFPASLYSAKIDNPDAVKKGARPILRAEVKDVDVLAFFLFAGLQLDARENDEELTEAQVEDWVIPSTFRAISNAVVVALTLGIHAPVPPGKTSAATASPAATAKKGPGASTSQRRKGSRTGSSSKRR